MGKIRKQKATTRCFNATSHVALSPVVFCTFYIPTYRRLQTNLNLQTTSLACRENMLFLVCSLSLMSVSAAPRMGVCFVQLPF